MRANLKSGIFHPNNDFEDKLMNRKLTLFNHIISYVSQYDKAEYLVHVFSVGGCFHACMDEMKAFFYWEITDNSFSLYDKENTLKYYLHFADFRNSPTRQIYLPKLPMQFDMMGVDSPNFGIPEEIKDSKNKKHELQSFEGKLVFDLWIVARTIDKCCDEDCNYTALYKVQWAVEMKEDYPFKTVGNKKPKEQVIYGKKREIHVNLLGDSFKVTVPNNWGEKLKDGKCPTVLDTLPYNTIINSCDFKILL